MSEQFSKVYGEPIIASDYGATCGLGLQDREKVLAAIPADGTAPGDIPGISWSREPIVTARAANPRTRWDGQ